MVFFQQKTYSVVKHRCSDKRRLSIFEENVVLLSTNGYEREASSDDYFPKNKSPYLGLLCILATSILFTLISFIVKKLSYLNTAHLILARNGGIFVGSLPIIVYRAEKVVTSREDIASLITRSTAGVIAIYLNVLAFQNLPLGDAAVIMSATPVTTIVFARVYLKEPCSCMESLAMGVTTIGVLLSLGLPDIILLKNQRQISFSYVLGFICAFGCVFARCTMYVVLRRVKDMHFSVVMMYFSLFGFIENAVIAYYCTNFQHQDCGLDSDLIMSTGIIAFIAYWILALAITLVQEGLVSVIRSCFDILIAMIFQATLCNDDVDLYGTIGASLVILPLIMMGFNIWLLTLPDDSNTKNIFRKYITR